VSCTNLLTFFIDILTIFTDLLTYFTDFHMICYQEVGHDGPSTLTLAPPKQERVVIHGVHHKTESHSQGALRLVLPKGLLSDMMVWWIKTGWQHLRHCQNSPTMFKSSYGFAFTDCTFTNYWRKIMKSAPPSLPYFPPNMARTSFVESYTASELYLTDSLPACLTH